MAYVHQEDIDVWQILATDIQKTMSLLQHTANYVFSHGTLVFQVNWL